jgi:hypothetical protein
MNYVDRQVAEALKEAGFDVPVTAYYSASRIKSEIKFERFLQNYNSVHYNRISAPNFLTAADWIFYQPKKGLLTFDFKTVQTRVEYDGSVIFGMTASQQAHHRNKALLFALQKLKELRAEETKQS